ncbi:MAG: polysaccharide biosynthesis C-terminal domain-containing protein [Candidatus Scatovivens sp.]
MPLAFNIAFATALVPAIAGARVKNDNDTINKKLSFSLLTTILIGLPCTLGMAMYSSQILKLLFPKAGAGGTLLAISSITIIFTALAQTINGALQGLGKVKVPAIALACGVLTKLIANIIFIPIEGIYENGAAIGSVLCHIVSFTIVYIVLRKTVKLNFKLSKMMIKPIIATIGMGVISYIFYRLSLNIIYNERISTIIGIIIAIIVYAVNVIILRIYKEEDIIMLPKGEKILKILKKMKIY